MNSIHRQIDVSIDICKYKNIYRTQYERKVAFQLTFATILLSQRFALPENRRICVIYVTLLYLTKG